MVKQFVSPVRVYKYPFELIAVAYQSRFPYNKRVPMMIRADILEEETSEDGTKEKKVRRITLKLDIPYIMKKISGLEGAVFIVTTELDWAARRFTITGRNETFSSRCLTVETCIFSVHAENSDWTCYEQDCKVEFHNVWGFEAQAEKLAIDRYIARLPKTKEVMELFVQDVKAAGLYVPPRYVPAQPTSDHASGAAAAATAGMESSSPQATSTSVNAASTAPASSGLSSSGGAAAAAAAASTAASSVTSNTSTAAAAVTTRTITPSSSPAVAGLSCTPTPVTATSSTSSGDRYRLRRKDSLGVDSDKLEEDYIQRFLGELTPYQESNLIQLRQKLSVLLKEKMPNDAVLLRFLRARDFHIDKARDMVTRHVAWRKQYQVDRLLDYWDPSDLLRQYYAGGWHHFDKRGHPVYLIRLGEIDLKGLLKAIGEADLLRQVVAHEEAGLRRCEQATRSSNKAISTVTLICDLDGLNLRHLWRPGIRVAERFIQVLLNNYPETMGRLLFVRAPRIFPVLWAIVSQFLDEATREKFVFFAGNDYQDKNGGLTDYIEPENVPDFLGGPCSSTVPVGGLVPKELYRKGEEEFSDPEGGGCALDTAYHMATIMRDRPCEVVLPVECDSVLFWDFDVSRGRVFFSVLRLYNTGDRKGQSESSTSAASAAMSAPSTTTLTTTATKNFSETGSYDSRQELSEALHVVGPDQHHENDSVQGTYTVNRSAIYLIRWEVCPSASATYPGVASTAATTTTAPSPGTSPPLHSMPVPPTPGSSSVSAGQSLSSSGTTSLSERLWPKANLMYYLEVIPSDRFKGSVSSLESWQSAVSTQSHEGSQADETDTLGVVTIPSLESLGSPLSGHPLQEQLQQSGSASVLPLSSPDTSTTLSRRRQLWTDV